MKKLLLMSLLSCLFTTSLMAKPGQKIVKKLNDIISAGPFIVTKVEGFNHEFYILGKRHGRSKSGIRMYSLISSVNPSPKVDSNKILTENFFASKVSRPRTYNEAVEICHSISVDGIQFELSGVENMLSVNSQLGMGRVHEFFKKMPTDKATQLRYKDYKLVMRNSLSHSIKYGPQFSYFWINGDAHPEFNNSGEGLSYAVHLEATVSVLQTIQKPLNFVCIAEYYTRANTTKVATFNRLLHREI